MLAYAQHEFELSKPDQNGVTVREHLEVVERQTKKRPKELEGPDFPYELAHIWSAFLYLCSGRSSGFNGPEGLSFSEIKAWSELTATPVSPSDVEIIKKLDSVYLRAANG